ncbi:MAG TPA: putative Na+/H+ antiporter [Verrucomicrobiae bacterium]|nr:putative Na+/H+ antiporter [Verrucomicrobiae bacterium]
MSPSPIELGASILFGLAVLHTFSCSRLLRLAHRLPSGSVAANLLHLLGEVEVVFGFWAVILFGLIALQGGAHAAIGYVEERNFTEPLFVFAIMTVAATRPIIDFATRALPLVARALPLPREIAIYFCCLSLGSLLGSFITEPAAMTIVALLLKRRYYERGVSPRMMYTTLAALLVNISIGGALTPFAAPPILMVAGKWGWTTSFMLETFGWRCALACAVNAALASAVNAAELRALAPAEQSGQQDAARPAPFWLVALHLLALALIVLTAHHPKVFVGVLLCFMAVTLVTREYQSELALRQSLLVACFLGGLVVLGGLQAWWLNPILKGLDDATVFLGATGLTAITDNAALTYLGSFFDNPTDSYKYALVAGALAGGGLTVIANAPNPAAFSILQDRFGPDGIHPLRLFLTALVPTLVAMICLGAP